MTIEDKIKEIVSNIFKVEKEKLTRDTSFVDDLHMKSINLIEMVAWIDEEFNLEINIGEVRKKKTLGDLIDYVEKLIS
ncbi:MAG: acyl carrier protein [Candidatus Bathyarchaeia archaeon]